MTVTIRRARTSDVRAIRDLVAPLAERRVLVSKDTVAYFEGLQEFRVAEIDGQVVGCGALHVMWDDLAEIRTGQRVDGASFAGLTFAYIDDLSAATVAGTFAGTAVSRAETIRRLDAVVATLSLLLVLADAVGRTAFEPRELPVGIVTALVGAPAFALLLLRSPRASS